MKATSSHARRKKIAMLRRRSDEWLASRYGEEMTLAVKYAKSKWFRFPEPVRGLLLSMEYHAPTPTFCKAVISMKARPFRGGLHQSYSWVKIATTDTKEMGNEMIRTLASYLRFTQKLRAQEALSHMNANRP